MKTRKCEFCKTPFKVEPGDRRKYCQSLCYKKAYLERVKERTTEETKQLPPLYNNSKYRCPKCGGAINHKECFACSLKKAK